MAKLNSDSSNNSSTDKIIWNTSHLLTLGIVNRFFRNYQRYRETSWQHANCKQLHTICYDLEHKIHAYEGLQITSNTHSSDFSHQVSTLLLRQQIYERFEHLHHQLLYRNPDAIDAIIPLIDQQLTLWNPEKTPSDISENDLIWATRTLSHIEMLIQDNLAD